MSRVLVAGMGNLLRGDDGFGVRVAQRLAQRDDLPDGVTIVEVGIGGVHLVQELMTGYDALIVVDAIARGALPGTLHLLEVEPPDIAGWSDDQRGDFLADTHYATPSKALILARALAVLPARAYLVGCEPLVYDELAIGLSPPVEAALDATLAQLDLLIARLVASPSNERAAASATGG